VRVALQALSAVLGGTQSLHTNSRDEALALPTEESARLALRTQQVIAEESGVANVVDPLGGSYYVEWLTDRIEHEAREELHKIDSMGGATAAIEKGHYQRSIAKSAYAQQKAVEEGDAEGIQKAVDELNAASHKLAEVLYKNASADGSQTPPPGAQEAGGASPGAGGDVVDAEVVSN
jgi:methylmalonyl-CoA mutase N-terminal domain/subunit